MGRYEIVRHWANGGMAEVLLARTKGIGGFERYVVVKRIHNEHAKDERFMRMFLDEARLAAMLHHGNIVQVHEVGEEAGRVYFAMEYVHGEDVRRLLRNLSVAKEKPPLEHVIAIVSATADALHHAHEQRGSDGKPLGLVHRDVTPANIIVGYDGIVKVVDFGIAKAALRTSETAGGTLKGKVAYMAPEQCMGKPVDRRSDVYALGVVLYEASCVRRLFKGDNDFLTMSSIIAGKIPSPTAHRPDLPKELEQIIMKALSIRPEDRFQTAAEMGHALEQFALSAGLRPSPKSLAAFLKQRFGTRPEPWLVEGGEADAALTADFDGAANGLVAPPIQALENLAIPEEAESSPSAPIRRAHKTATPAAKRHPLPGVKRSYTPPPRPKSQPAAAAAEAAQPSIVIAPELAPVTQTLHDGWGASDKEVTPSLMQPAFALGSVAVAADGPETAGPVDVIVPVARKRRLPAWIPTTLPVWLQSRRAQIAAGSAALLLLFIVIFASTRSSPKPAPKPAAQRPAEPPPAETVQKEPAPVPAPDPITAAKPAAAEPAKKPAVRSNPGASTSTSTSKKKRPKPKFLF